MPAAGATPRPSAIDRPAAWPALGRLRARALDIVLAVMGVAFGLPSLAFPYGRDQGLYHYIGREWSQGRLPYRDAFDVKTPGIYALHAVLTTLFDPTAIWPIRLAELVAVVGIGVLLARIVDREGKLAGLRGLGVLAASVGYYAYFNYWDTGQCEIWCVLLSALAVECALGGRAVVAGVLFGVAALFKPPSLIFMPFGALVLAWPIFPLRRALARGAWMALGIALPLALTALYFIVKGAWFDFHDVLFVNNRHYVVAGRWVHSFEQWLVLLPHQFRIDGALSFVLVNGMWAGGLAAWRRGHTQLFRLFSLTFLAFVAVVVAVSAQLKFCPYHWGLWVGPLTMAVLVGARAFSELAHVRRAVPYAAAILVVLVALNGRARFKLAGEGRSFLAWARGNTDSDAYLASIDIFTNYSWKATVRRARAINELAGPDDTLAVRGFEPQIYVLTGKRYPGRFFWTTFLITPEWCLHYEEWRAEDRRVLSEHPPDWVLAYDKAEESLDRAQWFENNGYTRAKTWKKDWMILLRRTPPGREP